MKSATFVGHIFPCKRDKQPTLKFKIKESVRMMPRVLEFLG